jgi:hypothetical protein
MSDIDPTPETPVTVGDRLGWWRGSQAAQHTALLAALAAQHTALLAALAAQHTALLAAIQASAGAGGATEATAAALLAAIGQLDTYPAGWTVRALLAQQITVIDAAPTGDPPMDPGLNADPGGCGEPYTYSGRATMINSGGWDMLNGERIDIWCVQSLNIDGAILENAALGVMEPDHNFVNTHPSGFVELCISWDFNDSLPVQKYGIRQADDAGTAGTPWVYIVPTLVGSQRVEMRFTNAQRYTAVYFAVPEGNPMPQNVFYHVNVWPGGAV